MKRWTLVMLTVIAAWLLFAASAVAIADSWSVSYYYGDWLWENWYPDGW